MNNFEFTSRLAEKLNVSFESANNLLNAMLDCMTEELGKKGSVKLIDFGMFNVVRRAPKKGFNPHYRKSVDIPACNDVKFTPGKMLKEIIKNS